MNEKKYEVVDFLSHVIARDMSLEMALLFIKAYCQEYYMEHATLTLREMDVCSKGE